jgi:PAS domain S-box-containing protein
MKPIQVMIVEDEPLIGVDLRENLINFGYNVVGISSSGEEAIEEAIKTRPEIVLMDIQLNGKLNGIETAKLIKKKLGIPIIYLTGSSDDKTLDTALEASPSGYLLKPFAPRQLHTSIQTALKQRTRHSEILTNLIEGMLFSQNIDDTSPHLLPLKEIAMSLEYSDDEIMRMGNLIIPLLIHKDDYDTMENYLKKTISNPGKSFEVELRFRHKTGIYRYFSFKGIFQPDESRKKIITHLARDITWIKNLENVSYISREKLTAISNNPYFGIAVLDKDAKFLNINPTIENLTGYSKDELNSLPFSDFIGTKELKNICLNFEKIKLNQLECFQAEAFIHTKNKGAIWFYLVFNAIYDTEKVLDRIVCTLVDISESKLFGKNEN